MHITFTPQSRFDALALSRQGDVLTVNGEAFDFGPLPDGHSVPVTSAWIVGQVERRDGELHIVIACPGIEADVHVTPADGEIEVPQ